MRDETQDSSENEGFTTRIPLKNHQASPHRVRWGLLQTDGWLLKLRYYNLESLEVNFKIFKLRVMTISQNVQL